MPQLLRRLRLQGQLPGAELLPRQFHHGGGGGVRRAGAGGVQGGAEGANYSKGERLCDSPFVKLKFHTVKTYALIKTLVYCIFNKVT